MNFCFLGRHALGDFLEIGEFLLVAAGRLCTGHHHLGHDGTDVERFLAGGQVSRYGPDRPNNSQR